MPCQVFNQKVMQNDSRMMTLLDGFLAIMSHDPLITWPCEIQGSLTARSSARKRLSRHQLLVYYEFQFSMSYFYLQNCA